MAHQTLGSAPGAIDWLEVHPENYIERGGLFGRNLDQARERWNIGTHGLTLSLLSTRRHDPGYTRQLRALLERIDAPWYSDHICTSGIGNAHLHDLLPAPRTAESRRHAVARIRELSDAIERPVAIENISYYVEPGGSERDDAEFIGDVLEEADAWLLLDVNNVYVNARNFGWDARDVIDRMPLHRVVQLHVAGHMIRPDGLRIDTHGEPICDDVYGLVEHALRRVGDVPVLLERDNNFPPLDILLAEIAGLRAARARALEVP